MEAPLLMQNEYHHPGQGKVHGDEHGPAQAVVSPFGGHVLSKAVAAGVAGQQEAHHRKEQIVGRQGAKPGGAVIQSRQGVEAGVQDIHPQGGGQRQPGAVGHVLQQLGHQGEPPDPLAALPEKGNGVGTDHHQGVGREHIAHSGNRGVLPGHQESVGQQAKAHGHAEQHHRRPGEQQLMEQFLPIHPASSSASR